MVVEPVGSQVVALLLCSKHLASSDLPCQDSANANTENTPNNTKNLALLFIFGPPLGLETTRLECRLRMIEHSVLHIRVFNELRYLADRKSTRLNSSHLGIS